MEEAHLTVHLTAIAVTNFLVARISITNDFVGI